MSSLTMSPHSNENTAPSAADFPCSCNRTPTRFMDLYRPKTPPSRSPSPTPSEWTTISFDDPWALNHPSAPPESARGIDGYHSPYSDPLWMRMERARDMEMGLNFFEGVTVEPADPPTSPSTSTPIPQTESAFMSRVQAIVAHMPRLGRRFSGQTPNPSLEPMRATMSSPSTSPTPTTPLPGPEDVTLDNEPPRMPEIAPDLRYTMPRDFDLEAGISNRLYEGSIFSEKAEERQCCGTMGKLVFLLVMVMVVVIVVVACKV